jgi:hypothetical protein
MAEDAHGLDGYRRREDDVPRRRQFDRGQDLADAFGDRVSAVDEYRHVGPELEREPLQLATRETGSPQMVERDEDGRGVRAASPESATDRQALHELDIGAERRASCGLQQEGRTEGQVGAGFDTGDLVNRADPSVRTDRDAHIVAVVDQSKDRLQ